MSHLAIVLITIIILLIAAAFGWLFCWIFLTKIHPESLSVARADAATEAAQSDARTSNMQRSQMQQSSVPLGYNEKIMQLRIDRDRAREQNHILTRHCRELEHRLANLEK